jgi:hypothetical protein
LAREAATTARSSGDIGGHLLDGGGEQRGQPAPLLQGQGGFLAYGAADVVFQGGSAVLAAALDDGSGCGRVVWVSGRFCRGGSERCSGVA